MPVPAVNEFCILLAIPSFDSAEIRDLTMSIPIASPLEPFTTRTTDVGLRR